MNENTQLALLRTLFALERNYFALERTQLAQLRTGLSIAIIAPSAAATLTYIFGYISESFEIRGSIYILLIALTIYGVYVSLHAYTGLRRTRAVRAKILKREKSIIEETEFAKFYLGDIFLSDKS